MSGTKWEHDVLAADLAGHLFAPQRMVWRDLQLGPAGSPRPDVYTIAKSFIRPNPTAYECKISVADFRRDVTSCKWQSYQQFASAVVFAAPAGLIAVSDIPPMCGLILRHEQCWRLAKKPTICPVKIPQEAFLKLLIDGVERQGPIYRARHWDKGVSEFTKRFGSDAARWVNDSAAVKSVVEKANFRAKAILDGARAEAEKIKQAARSDSPALWRDLCEVLEIPLDSTKWTAKEKIRKINLDMEGGEDKHRLKLLVNEIQSSIKRLVPPDQIRLELRESR